MAEHLSPLGLIAPAFLCLADRMSLPSVKTWMLVFSVAWHAIVPL